MKKFILTSAVCLCVASGAWALSITDPLFMPQEGGTVSETSLNITDNAFKLQDSFGLREKMTLGVYDNLSVSASLGWAKIKNEHSGLQDPQVEARYRFLDGTQDNLFLDMEAYISPEIFDSIYDKEDGSAKGSTDYGLHSIVGSTEAVPNMTLAAKAGFDYIGSSDLIDSGTVWSAEGNAKYYINELNSVGAQLALREYLGFEKDASAIGLGLNYDYQIIPDTMAAEPFFYIEAKDHAGSAYKGFGLNVKYMF